MRHLRSLPCPVEEIENIWIPMPDGCRLAARLWLPESASASPVPAIIEYIPYRKRDMTRERDEAIHRYFAGNGYASVRIDLRGSGDSDGVLLDEYLDQEIRDGADAMAWLVSQPWCNGRLGMMGKSWGGFNSLQLAARRPPQLQAIIAVCAADDRYADDAHYMGGCLLNENLIWGSALFTINAQPPDAGIVGPRWRELWMQRLETTQPFPTIWLRHQRRDDYWKHGSVCEDFGRIDCPVYAVGGWADGYSNAVPRLLAHLQVPCKGLVGPWGHLYPHEGVPGPAIGFLQEALRWWDYWLKDVDTGIMREPVYRVWMQPGFRAGSFTEQHAGRWIAEPRWPAPAIGRWRRYLHAEGLREQPGPEQMRILRSPQHTGLGAGAWCSFGFQGEMPTDQREDDAKSLCFDTPALERSLEILGRPLVEFSFKADAAAAFLVARLNDVAPDGHSTRVSYGVLNLTHLNGHERPQALVPGKRYTARLALNDIAHAFLPGHRIRLALSNAYWPLIWPSPGRATLEIGCGASVLELPVRAPGPQDAALAPFERPEAAAAVGFTDLHPSGAARTIERDPATGFTVYTTRTDLTDAGEPALTRIEPIDLTIGHGVLERFEIEEHDPLSARAVVEHRTYHGRGDWVARVHTTTRLQADAGHFILSATMEVFENGERVFARDWHDTIARDFV